MIEQVFVEDYGAYLAQKMATNMAKTIGNKMAEIRSGRKMDSCNVIAKFTT